jgi:MerR family transcriptional regulator/heat shock protein HspR
MTKRRKQNKPVMISVVAERYDIHPQTLRLYEREGLLQPRRSAGNTRLYDDATLRRLETILTLTRDMGVNLAGVDVILKLREQLEQLERELDRLRSPRGDEEPARAARVRRHHALVHVRSGPLQKLD